MATVVAFLMYLDRICLADITSSDSFKSVIHLTDDDKKWVLGGFFWAYALAQVPAGWMSDRFGARGLVTIYIAIWSIATAATGFAVGFWSLFVARLVCGLAEAGYYPASSGMVTRWAHQDSRGMASSIISWGGRVGGAAAPLITVFLIAHFSDWRWAGWIYGFSGVGVALFYWYIFRNHPREHPRCNKAELDLLAEGRGDFLATKTPPRAFPWKAALTSGNLWLANAVQFFTNVGWVFMVLYLQDYLIQIAKIPAAEAGKWKTIALSIGILSLPIGGWLTDRLSRALGRRRGRMIPTAVSKFVAAGFYLLAMWAESPWAIAVMFGCVTFFGDLGLPALWTTMQDISGKHQAQLFGWGNMWGNLGAGIMPFAFTWVLATYDSNHDLHEGVWLCAGSFVLAGVFGLFVDAERPVTSEAL